jgi:hypothetical protein
MYVLMISPGSGKGMNVLKKPNSKNDICPICLDIHGTRKIDILPKCKHEFHSKCIKKWVKNGANNTCPVCRETIHDGDDDDFITSYPLVPDMPDTQNAIDMYNLHIVEGYDIPYQTYNIALSIIIQNLSDLS